jgi:hypothetical protein
VNVIDELLRSLYVMASMVEARDPYTGGHLWRVSQFSRILAADISLPDTDVARIALGGFLHDLGKIGVPDAVLRKPGPLTSEEYAVIKTHPEVGNRLLSAHPLAELARAAILCHHETPNGTGYPQRLAGRDIPLDARIVGLSDAFDAMTSNRPYRRGMPVSKALTIISEGLDAQFDRKLGSRFVELGNAGTLDAIVGFSEPGIPVQECPLCGPTIVVRRRNRTGDLVYCRNCGNEAVVNWEGDVVHISPTGGKGTVENLQPDADIDLIDALIRESVRHIEHSTHTGKHGIFGLFQRG